MGVLKTDEGARAFADDPVADRAAPRAGVAAATANHLERSATPA